MEKRSPTYDLDAFKKSFSKASRLSVTGTALRTAASMGCGRAEIVETIQTMERGQFVKSMTTHADHRAWQDVYHVPRGGKVVYLKFTADVVTEFRLLSFKERDNE
ncbi:MAG: type II toxin-antitoxin system MqsR family toxin [Magnetococcales bacterium]|nr:type II toxin-antitoxin system MqsR family toxin [Magnetococcales bacterium]